MQKKPLTIRIDEQMRKQIEKLAEVSKRSVSDYVRLVIEIAIQKKTKV